MTHHYIPQELVDESLEISRQHVSIGQIPARTGIEKARLRDIIGLPELKSFLESSECDLSAADEMQDAL